MQSKVRIFLLLFICFSFGLIIDSCCKGYKLRWEYIITQTLDNGEITENDSINAENYGIRINMINQKFALNSVNPLIQEVYAYDCSPTYAILDTIVEIKVFTINNLDATFLAGSDITELFTGNLLNTEILSVDELIYEINKTFVDDDEYFNLFINYNIANSSNQKFLVSIELSDNRFLDGEVREAWLY